MKNIFDLILANIPIMLLILIFSFLIYSEFADFSVNWGKVSSLLRSAIVGTDSVKVLG